MQSVLAATKAAVASNGSNRMKSDIKQLKLKVSLYSLVLPVQLLVQLFVLLSLSKSFSQTPLSVPKSYARNLSPPSSLGVEQICGFFFLFSVSF